MHFRNGLNTDVKIQRTIVEWFTQQFWHAQWHAMQIRHQILPVTSDLPFTKPFHFCLNHFAFV